MKRCDGKSVETRMLKRSNSATRCFTRGLVWPAVLVVAATVSSQAQPPARQASVPPMPAAQQAQLGQTSPPASSGGTAAAVQPVTQAVQNPPANSEAPTQLHLLVGRSLVISSPNRIKRVSLADPAIAGHELWLSCAPCCVWPVPSRMSPFASLNQEWMLECAG